MTLKELREKRANVWEQMKADLEEMNKGEITDEQRQAYDKKEAELEKLTGDIEREERAEKHRKDRDRRDDPIPTPGPDDDPAPSRDDQYRDAFNQYLRRGISGVSQEHREILQQGAVQGDEFRAQGVATGGAGGYLVPQDFRNRITERMKFFGGMREVSEVIETTTGADLPWPTNDDSSNLGELLAENTAAAEQDVTLGQKILKAYMFSSKIVRVSLQLIQDEAFDLDSFLERKLAERIARIQNQYFTTGTGTGQPQGIVTGVSAGKTGATGQVTTVTYGDTIDLEHSVDVAYRNGRARYMFHDLTLAALRKLMDDNNRPLWVPSVVQGVPDTWNGHPYTVNNDMPVMAASAKSILFGDFFAAYVIRVVKEFSLMRLTERYAEFLQVGFLGFERADGLVQDSNAVKAYAHPAT